MSDQIQVRYCIQDHQLTKQRQKNTQCFVSPGKVTCMYTAIMADLLPSEFCPWNVYKTQQDQNKALGGTLAGKNISPS